MKLSNKVKLVTINFKGVGFPVYYLKSENHDVTLFDVKVDALDLNSFTGPYFKISWCGATNLLSYPSQNQTDLEIKHTIIETIFKKEKIYPGQ
jgi:hypothetical protein